MSQIPADLRYTKSHEWMRTLPDGTVEIGITDHAQQSLGDLVFVEVPEAGRQEPEFPQPGPPTQLFMDMLRMRGTYCLSLVLKAWV